MHAGKRSWHKQELETQGFFPILHSLPAQEVPAALRCGAISVSDACLTARVMRLPIIARWQSNPPVLRLSHSTGIARTQARVAAREALVCAYSLEMRGAFASGAPAHTELQETVSQCCANWPGFGRYSFSS
jgi:hypothetical protein